MNTGLTNLADYCLSQRIDEGLGDKPSVLFGDIAYSYHDVHQRMLNLARYFVSIDIKPQSRIYILLPDTPPFVWTFFATVFHGAVGVMGNPNVICREWCDQINITKPSVIVTTPQHALTLTTLDISCDVILLVPDVKTGDCPEQAIDSEIIASIQQETSAICLSLTDAMQQTQNTDIASYAIERQSPAVLLFTSSSTGAAKAAIHSHAGLIFNIEQYAKKTIGYCRDDITLSVSRLFFGYATGANLLFPFAVGGTVSLFVEHPTVKVLQHRIKQYRPTIVINVPTMLAKMTADDAEPIDMSSVRFSLTAGEPLASSLWHRFTACFEHPLYDGIGSAESFHIYATNRKDDLCVGSLGKVVEGYDIKILPKDCWDVTMESLPEDQTGVLWVRGGSIAMGYFEDIDNTNEVFIHGWCRTNDLCCMRGGYLWFMGRANDLFKSKGRWIAPFEIEQCLLEYPQIEVAAVLAVDIAGSLMPKAFVVSKDVHNQETLIIALKAFLKERLSWYKCPQEIVFLDQMPLNDRGKILRKELVQT